MHGVVILYKWSDFYSFIWWPVHSRSVDRGLTALRSCLSVTWLCCNLIFYSLIHVRVLLCLHPLFFCFCSGLGFSASDIDIFLYCGLILTESGVESVLVVDASCEWKDGAAAPEAPVAAAEEQEREGSVRVVEEGGGAHDAARRWHGEQRGAALLRWRVRFGRTRRRPVRVRAAPRGVLREVTSLMKE